MASKVLTASMSAALERGDRALRDYLELLERGSEQDVWADEMRRGAAVRLDIIKRRAVAPAVEPTQGALWAHAERLLKAGEIKPWGAAHA